MQMTPKDFAQQLKGVVMPPLPPYDWTKQGRGNRATLWAGSYTGNSVQTFDAFGRPHDSTSDNND